MNYRSLLIASLATCRPFCYCHERRSPVVGTDQIAAFSLIAPRA